MEFNEETFKIILDMCEWVSDKALLSNADYHDKLCCAIIDIAIDKFNLYDDFTEEDLITCFNKHGVEIALELTILYN